MDPPVNSGPWMESGREAGLVLSAQKGDRPAFLELIREYQRPLFHLCFAFVRDPEEAARLSHECALHAWRGLKHLAVGRPFFPWLSRIARNLAVTRQRRRAGDQLGRVPLVRPNGDAWNAPRYSAAEAARDPQVLQAFSLLSPDDQMVLALKVLEDLDYGALGLVLDCQLGAAMHRVATSRERLQEVLPTELGEDAA